MHEMNMHHTAHAIPEENLDAVSGGAIQSEVLESVDKRKTCTRFKLIKGYTDDGTCYNCLYFGTSQVAREGVENDTLLRCKYSLCQGMGGW